MVEIQKKSDHVFENVFLAANVSLSFAVQSAEFKLSF
jgi:hypothetical protein